MTPPSNQRFALIGAAGFVAPRHMRAIRDTGNQLIAACDVNDSVGIIDSYFPDADFFVEIERFDRHLEKEKRRGKGIDFLSICSPNYLHDAHIRFGLRLGAHVICEKPLVLNPWNIDALDELSKETGKNVFNILQLRLHPSVIALREKYLRADEAASKPEIELTYLTSRGHWYHTSWKGDIQKSGGIATNIGVHFFDMLLWIFGPVQQNIVHIHTHDRAAGYLELANARVRWFLSINADTLPAEAVQQGKRTWRSLTVDGDQFEFSEGFGDLHTMSYQSILEGNGFPLEAARPSIEVVQTIRHQAPIGLKGDYHPMAALPQAPHPFSSHR